MNQSEVYVDGFLLAVPTEKLETYRALAEKAAEVWREHGALDYRECVGDDLNIEGMVSFQQSAAAAAGETVILAWITYENREQRDAINAKVMADPRIAGSCDPNNLPFDCKRMAYGGFRTLVHR